MKPIKGLKLRKGFWYIKIQVNGRRIRKSLKLPEECLAEANEIMKKFWLEVAEGNIRFEPILNKKG